MRLRDERVMWRYEEMDLRSTIDEARAGLAAMPGELLPMRRLAVLLVDHGSPNEIEESADLTEATLEIEPENANAWRALALARAKTGDFDRSEVAMREAVRLAPGDWQLRYQFAMLLNERRKRDLAEIELAESIRLWEAAGGETIGDRPVLPDPVPTTPLGPQMGPDQPSSP
jgi:predicted Zn-dependent protease